jgi:acyl-coenzyme A synthetase/AMP-(fatty) acid ligase
LTRDSSSLIDRVPESYNIATACCDRWVAEGHGERTAIHFEGEGISYQDLHSAVNRLGNGLRSLGLGAGQRYLIRLPSRPEFYIAFLAGLKIGAVAVPTPQLLQARELRHVIKAANVRLVVTSESLAEPIRSIRDELPTLEHVVCLDSSERTEHELSELINGSDEELSVVDTKPDEPAYVLFSSGTTGLPKGIAQAHRANNICAGNPGGKYGMELHPEDIVFQPHDPAWSYSVSCGFLFTLCEGASIVASPKRVRPEDALQWVEQYRVTVFASVPTFYRAILSNPKVEVGVDVSSLRHCLSAGEPLTTNTYHEWKRRVGVPILDHMGQGELSMFCANRPSDKIKPGSFGRPLPGYRIAVVDKSGQEVIDEVGELVVSEDNPGLFYDYLGMPEKWDETHRGGWYYTGDLARQDDEGFFWYTSRSDDLITSRGYLISPKEVENCLVDHPSVLEAGVVGHRHDQMGQIVTAYIVLHDGTDISPTLEDELIAHTREQIAPVKAPKKVVFLAELPKTSTGKILRRQLRSLG